MLAYSSAKYHKVKKDDITILLEKFLRKTATPEEAARLVELFGRPETREVLESYYEEKWAQEHSPVDRETEERMLANLRGRIGTPTTAPKVPLRRRFARVAAAVLIPLLTAGTLWFYFDARSYKHSGDMTFSVATGQKADMQLPDGTHVWLNSSSAVSYGNDYNRRKRVVNLQGEAYFEVRKGKRPFIVMAEGLAVEALGTSFNVKAYPGDGYVTTTLVEGSVRVSDEAQSDIMRPNEQLTYTTTDGLFSKLTLTDAGRLVGWRNNQLAFERETLGEIARVLERMYNVTFVFEYDDLRDIRFSGRIRNNNLESILQMISVVSPILYSIEDSTIYIKENPSEKHLYKRVQ